MSDEELAAALRALIPDVSPPGKCWRLERASQWVTCVTQLDGELA